MRRSCEGDTSADTEVRGRKEEKGAVGGLMRWSRDAPQPVGRGQAVPCAHGGHWGSRCRPAAREGSHGRASGCAQSRPVLEE